MNAPENAPMPASADLTCWVTPKSGPMRPVRTLGDLRKAFLDDLPHQCRYQRHWFAVGRLLKTAMETQGRLDRMLCDGRAADGLGGGGLDDKEASQRTDGGES